MDWSSIHSPSSYRRSLRGVRKRRVGATAVRCVYTSTAVCRVFDTAVVSGTGPVGASPPDDAKLVLNSRRRRRRRDLSYSPRTRTRICITSYYYYYHHHRYYYYYCVTVVLCCLYCVVRDVLTTCVNHNDLWSLHEKKKKTEPVTRTQVDRPRRRRGGGGHPKR